MMTSRPRASAPVTYSSTRSGVRCADMTRASLAICRRSSVSAAWLIVSQSDTEPMMIPTSGVMGRYCSKGAALSPRRGRPPDHSPHDRFQHDLVALVHHLVLVSDDPAVWFPGLPFVGDRHGHADGVAGQHGRDHPDLA